MHIGSIDISSFWNLCSNKRQSQESKSFTELNNRKWSSTNAHIQKFAEYDLCTQ